MQETTPNITLPEGWYADDENKNSAESTYDNTAEFIAHVNNTLSPAAQRTEELIDELYNQLDIVVNTAYLTIDADTAYHVFLLVSLEEYHSPHIQAAQLMTEKFTGNTLNLAIRFTFTVDREHIISYVSSSRFKLKHERSI